MFHRAFWTDRLRHAPDFERTSEQTNRQKVMLKLTNDVTAAAGKGAGVSVQHASLCIANNSLGSASLLLKNRPAGRQSGAGLSREESRVCRIHETVCPGIGNYQPALWNSHLQSDKW